MEHEKVIREKVLGADSMVVSWRKDRVWNQLQQIPERKRSGFMPYAVAAGLALIAVIAYVLQVRNEQQTNEQIARLELAIRKSESILAPSVSVKSELCQQEVETKSFKSLAKNAPVRTVGDSAPGNNEQVEVVPPAEKIEILSETTAMTKVETTQPPIIQAIVGRIPEQLVPVASGKRKKVLLFPTEKIDKSLAATSNGAILTARIN